MNKRLLSILLCASVLGGVIPFAFPLTGAAVDTIGDSYANDLYEPQTALAQAPIVMQTATAADTDITALEKRPSALIFDVRVSDGTLVAYDGMVELGNFADLYYLNQPKTNVGARIALGDTDAAAALATYVTEAGADNLWVISPDVEVLNTVTAAAPLARGVIDFAQGTVYAPADVTWTINTEDYTQIGEQTYTLRYFTKGIDDLTREQIYDIFYSRGSGYTTALLPESDTSAELVTMLSAMGIFTIVETDATDEAGFYDAILTGANGILSSSYDVNIATLEDTALFPADTPTLVRPAALIAHRGDAMYRSGWKENSLPALISASESGGTLIEFDVYMTTDKRLVLMHDEYTGTKYTYPSDCPLDEETQTANAAKKISERAWEGDLEYVRWTADDGVTTGPVNQLYELLEAVDTEYPDVYMYLEMKTGYSLNPDGSITNASYEPYNRVIELINQHGVRQRTTLLSFSTITTEYGHAMGFAARQLNAYGVTAGTGDIKTIVTNLKNQHSNIFEQSVSVYTADTTALQTRLRHYGFTTVVGGVDQYTDLANVLVDGINRITNETIHRTDKEVRRLIADYDPTTGKISASYEHYRHKSDGLFDETSKTEEVYHYWIEQGYATVATTSAIADADFEIVTIAGNPTVDNDAKTATGTDGDVIAIRYKKQAIRKDCDAYYYTYSPAIRLGAAVDKEALQSTVSSAQALSAKQDSYTALSWKLMSDALTEATAISAATDATQATVDAAQASLQRRINELSYKEGATVDRIAYVNADDPSSTPALDDIDNPYATISEAIAALDKLTGSVNRIVKVVGDYTCEVGVESFDATNNKFYGLATHTNLISIEGNDPTDATALVDITGVCSAGGPLKFDNIHFNIKDNQSVFHSNGFPVEFGANAVPHYTSSSYGRVASGGYHQGLRTDYETRVHELTTNQSFDHVILGDNNPNKVYTIPGIHYVMNGGTVNRLAVGSSKDTYPNHFTGNVNVELNGGTVNQVRMGADSYFFATYASGVAVQIIANNGVAIKEWRYNSTTSTTPPTITDVEGQNCLYVLKAEKNTYGATLSTTDKVGVYTTQFNGNGTAIATATAEDGTVYTSVDGTLKVEKPGVYTVTWEVELEGDVIAYVDAADPSSTPTINDIDNPYATISAAITALDALEGNINRIVKVKGAYTCEVGVESFDATNNKFYGLATHTNLISIEGNDPTDATALVDITGVCSAGGPLKFDNIHFNITNNTSVFYAGGFPVEFGANAVPHYTSSSYGRVASGGYHQGLRTDYETRVHDLTTNQSFNHVILGDNNPNKIYTIPGVNYVMNGGTVSRLAVGSSKDTYPNHFTGNVNIELNGGTVEQVRMGASSYFFATYASGVAVQIIANNGMALNTWYYNSTTSTTPPTITDVEGQNCLYVLKAEKNAYGATLSTTDKVGVYTVNGAATAIATDTSGNRYTSVGGTLTVPRAGIYTVAFRFGDVHGAQARDSETSDLRFIATATVSGVTFRDDGTADYSAATLTLGEDTVSVLDVGMLVSLSRSSASDLVVAADGTTLSGVKKVSAQKLQNAAYAVEKGYRGEDETFILFTAVVRNIPTAYVGSAITARAYVSYTDADGQTAYLYSDCLSRAYSAVAPTE